MEKKDSSIKVFLGMCVVGIIGVFMTGGSGFDAILKGVSFGFLATIFVFMFQEYFNKSQ